MEILYKYVTTLLKVLVSQILNRNEIIPAGSKTSFMLLSSMYNHASDVWYVTTLL